MTNKVKPSLLKQYIEEREGKELIEDERGFATFYFTGSHMYIEDIFVAEEYRREGVATQYANTIAAIALNRGYRKLLGSVQPSANGSNDSLKTLLAYGFKLLSIQGDLIYFEKDIGEGLSLIEGDQDG